MNKRKLTEGEIIGLTNLALKESYGSNQHAIKMKEVNKPCIDDVNKELYTPLQALNNVRYHFFQPSSIISKDMNEWFEIIETAIKENDYLKIELLGQSQELKMKNKALEIIKEKRVNVANFIHWLNKEPRTYEQYLNDYYQEGWHLHFRDNNDERCKLCKLSLTEFNILLEVLL